MAGDRCHAAVAPVRPMGRATPPPTAERGAVNESHTSMRQSSRGEVVACRVDEIREHWAEFLSRYAWDAFATLTYGDAVWSSEKIMRNFQRWLWEWQVRTAVARGLVSESLRVRTDGYGRRVGQHRKLSGTWWNEYRKGRAHPIWVVGIEPHRSGKLHAHAIIKWSRRLPDLRRTEGWRLWSGKTTEGGLGFGWCRIEPPKSQDDVNRYVSKYVTKGGEITLSPSFDAARLVAV